MEKENKRNGKFVTIEGAPFSDEQVRDIKEVARGLSLVFPDGSVSTQFEDNEATIRIFLTPKKRKFRIKGLGEHWVRPAEKEFTGVTVKFVNHLGYSNDPFYSKDYDSKEEQLEVWIMCPNHRIRYRWKKDFLPWEPREHFGYAYKVEDLYEDTIKPGLRQFIERFQIAYPELTRTSGMLHRQNWN